MSEMDRLIQKGDRSTTSYPEPLSLTWRVVHAVAYLIGGSTFFFGSLQYFPSVNNLTTRDGKNPQSGKWEGQGPRVPRGFSWGL